MDNLLNAKVVLYKELLKIKPEVILLGGVDDNFNDLRLMELLAGDKGIQELLEKGRKECLKTVTMTQKNQ